MDAEPRLGEQLKREALGMLLDKGLCVSSDDQLLIAHDESLAPYSSALVEELVIRDISAAFINVPKAYQRFLVSKILSQPEVQWLPSALLTAISTSSAILNVLDGDLETSRLRKAIIDQPRTRDCRLAHIPGLTDEVLSVTLNTDFEEILKRSELVAWILGNGVSAEYVTYDKADAEYVLYLDLEGWVNEPLMSPGSLLRGSWGNFPPGETFCCPTPTGVHGSVCINGSLPRMVLSADEAIVLHFENGRLDEWRAVNSSPAVEFFDKQKAIAKTRNDPNWNVFAEFGIGLNPAIRALTGNSLFDEKAAGTVHIAIGDNTTFGHGNKASMHADLVSWRPTLRIDGTTVLSRGEFQEAKLEMARQDWVPPSSPLPTDRRVRIRDGEVKSDSGVLKRRLCKAGRIGLVQMGDQAVGRALQKLYDRVMVGEPILVEQLVKELPVVDGIDVLRLMAILHHYNCLYFR